MGCCNAVRSDNADEGRIPRIATSFMPSRLLSSCNREETSKFLHNSKKSKTGWKNIMICPIRWYVECKLL